MSEAFLPATGSTVNISVASSSANVQVTGTGTSGVSQVRIMNDGTATVWIKHGTDNTVTATISNLPIGAGATEVLSFQNPCWIAAIAAGSTGKIYFTPGSGL